MKINAASVLIGTLACLPIAGCGSAAEPAREPTATTPDGTQVPLPTDDGELEEGDTEMTVEQPDGDEKKVEVEVDDD